MATVMKPRGGWYDHAGQRPSVGHGVLNFGSSRLLRSYHSTCSWARQLWLRGSMGSVLSSAPGEWQRLLACERMESLSACGSFTDDGKWPFRFMSGCDAMEGPRLALCMRPMVAAGVVLVPPSAIYISSRRCRPSLRIARSLFPRALDRSSTSDGSEEGPWPTGMVVQLGLYESSAPRWRRPVAGDVSTRDPRPSSRHVVLLQARRYTPWRGKVANRFSPGMRLIGKSSVQRKQ